jgi:hypothetical protein
MPNRKRCLSPSDSYESALIGYKAAIFAFGQTGSGKTYTMSGGPDKKDGLIQQTFELLRRKLREESQFEY